MSRVAPGSDHSRLAGAAAALLVAVSGTVSFMRGVDGFDDAYITYVVARGFAAGQGLLFEGVPVHAATSPFYAVVLGTLSRLLGIEVPSLGAAISFLSLPLLACGLVLIGLREGWIGAALLAGLTIVTAPLLLTHIGSEFLPATACVVAASAFFASGRDRAAGVALFLAAAFRTECGIAAPLLAMPILRLPNGWRRAIRAGGVAVSLFVAWTVTLLAVGGAVIPATLAAKQAQAESAIGYWISGFGYVWSALAALPGQLLGSQGVAAAVLFSAALAAGLFALSREAALSGGQALALAFWGPAQIVLVALLGVAGYDWYAIPFAISTALIAAFAWELSGRLGRVARWSLRALAVAPLLFSLVSSESVGSVWGPRGDPDLRRSAYAEIARALDSHPDGTRLASYEVGYLSYFARNPVVDLLGLVTPGVPLDAIRRGELSVVRAALRPDLVLLGLDGGRLFQSVVGDPASFLADFRLDRLLLARPPLLALFRRATLPGVAPVTDDLLVRASAEGRRVEFVERRNGAALALVMGAGESMNWEIDGSRQGEVTGGLWVARGARLALEIRSGGQLVGGGSLRGGEALRWEGWRVELQPRPGRAEIALACDGPLGECWVAFPRIERGLEGK